MEALVEAVQQYWRASEENDSHGESGGSSNNDHEMVLSENWRLHGYSTLPSLVSERTSLLRISTIALMKKSLQQFFCSRNSYKLETWREDLLLVWVLATAGLL